MELLQKAGAISKLVYQPRYELIPKQDGERAVTYVGDFQYEENGQIVCEDSKGFRNPTYILKRKILLWRHGIRIRET